MRMKFPLSVGFAIAAILVVSVLPVNSATENRAGPPGFQTDIEGAPFEAGLSVAGRFLAARHAESVGNLVAAADLTAGVLGDAPTSESLQRRAHRGMGGAGRFDDAAAIAEELLTSRPDDPLVVYTLIVRAFHNGAYARSLELLEDIPTSGVNAIVAPLLKAWSLAGLGRTADGIAALDTMARIAGLAPVAGFHQALIAEIGDDNMGAEAAFRRTLAASGERPSLQLVDSFARFLMRNDQKDEARSLVDDFRGRNKETLLVDSVRDVVEGRAEPDPLFGDGRRGAA